MRVAGSFCASGDLNGLLFCRQVSVGLLLRPPGLPLTTYKAKQRMGWIDHANNVKLQTFLLDLSSGREGLWVR